MAIAEKQHSINISSAQFALSNFTNVDNGESFKSLNEILINFRKKPDAWLECECLFHTQDETQVFYGIIILIDLIKYKWNCLSMEHQECLSTFIMGKVLKLATIPKLSSSEEIILKKFNQCLIELYLMKWSRDEWPNFLSDLIQTCNSNEYLCQNNLIIFKSIYESVFLNELSLNLLTDKLDGLRNQLNSSFDRLSQLILSILELSRNVILVQRSLDLLDVFIHLKFDLSNEWDKIFNHLSALLLISVIRKDAMRSLLVLLKHTKSTTKVTEFYKTILEQLIKVIPSSVVLKDNYTNFKTEDQAFLVLISDLLAEFTHYLYSISSKDSEKGRSGGGNGASYDSVISSYLEDAWLFLLRLTAVEDKEIQTICYEYWSQLSSTVSSGIIDLQLLSSSSSSPSPPTSHQSNSKDNTDFKSKASVYLCEVAEIIIGNNSTENTNGLLNSWENKVMIDTTDLLYVSVQNTYRNYFYVNPKQCIEQIKTKFNQLLALPQVSIKHLYSISRCISFIFYSDQVHSTNDMKLITLLLELIRFCFNSLLTLQNQMLRYRDQIPICCSTIYLIGCYSVVGKYHWSLTRVCIRRLFQFITVGNDLLKQLALENLKKWSLYNWEYFVAVKSTTETAALVRIMNDTNSYTLPLNRLQIVDFFDSMAIIVAKVDDPLKQEDFTKLLLKNSNEAWFYVYNQLSDDIALLLDDNLISSLQLNIFINTTCCRILKSTYLIQLIEIYPSLLNICNIISLSLDRIKEKLGKTSNLSTKPLKNLVELHTNCMDLIETILIGITWNSETYSDICSSIIPFLISDYTRCTELSWYLATVTTIRQLVDTSAEYMNGSHGVLTTKIASIITGILPPPHQSVFLSIDTNHNGNNSNNNVNSLDRKLDDATQVQESCSITDSGISVMMTLIRSIVKHHIGLVTNSNYSPFINLIYIIDFVLLGLKAIRNETRQLSYSIIELILQHYESDRVNPHQRKKFIRQFYMQILQTVLISALDTVRNLEEDGFTRVIRTLSRWLSSSLMSFRLFSRSNMVGDNKKSSTSNTNNSLVDVNREAVANNLITLLSNNLYPHLQYSTHSNLVFGLLRGAPSASTINDYVRQYKILANQMSLSDDSEMSSKIN